ncbi:hypothetical protein ACS0TY_010790 [Phlomoides rotata]
MKMLTYNIRGLGSRAKRREIRESITRSLSWKLLMILCVELFGDVDYWIYHFMVGLSHGIDQMVHVRVDWIEFSSVALG